MAYQTIHNKTYVDLMKRIHGDQYEVDESKILVAKAKRQALAEEATKSSVEHGDQVSDADQQFIFFSRSAAVLREDAVKAKSDKAGTEKYLMYLAITTKKPR